MGATAPPPFPRSPTGEIDALKGALEMLSVHMRGMSDELKAERDARQNEKKNGISVLNLHVPLVVVLGLFGTLTIAAIAVGSFYHKANTHFDNGYTHLDQNTSIAKHGPAYAADVKEAVESEASDRAADFRRVERSVRGGAQCRPSKVRGEFLCAFADPELLKLRPP